MPRLTSSPRAEPFLAAGIFVLVAVLAMHFRESLFVHETWLFGEPSWPMWVVDHLLKGQMIYRDASFSYGVLPTYYLAAAAKVFGSTAHTMALFSALPGALSAASAMVFLRRTGAATRTRWLLWILIVAPALWHSSTNLPAYANFEAALLITIFSILRPVDDRTRANAFVVGALMGLLNLTKFGSFLGIGVAVIAWDSLRALSMKRNGKGIFVHMLDEVVRPELMILTGFLCLEIPRVLVSWCVFPPEIWRDFVIFPLDLLKSYNTFKGGWDVVSFVRDAGWGFRIGTIGLKALLIALVAGGATVALIRTWRARGCAKAADAMLLLSALWFGVGFLFYYHHLDHIVVYSTPLIVPAAALLARFKWMPQLAIGVFLCACTGGVMAAKLLLQKDGRVAVVMPNGERLWFKPKEKAVYEQISVGVNALLKEPATGGSGAVVVWRAIGAGWHHYMRWPEASRHGYLISHEWVRPYERERVMSDFLSSSVFLAKLPADGDSLKVTADRSTWRTRDWLRVAPEYQESFVDRLEPPVKVETAANCWLAFKLKPVKP